MRKPKAPPVEDNAAMRRLLTRTEGGSQFRKMVALGVAYREVYESVAGRKVILDLLRQAGVLEPGFVPGDADAVTWNDGRRSLGLHMLTMMRWSEGELVKLATERTGEDLGDHADA